MEESPPGGACLVEVVGGSFSVLEEGRSRRKKSLPPLEDYSMRGSGSSFRSGRQRRRMSGSSEGGSSGEISGKYSAMDSSSPPPEMLKSGLSPSAPSTSDRALKRASDAAAARRRRGSDIQNDRESFAGSDGGEGEIALSVQRRKASRRSTTVVKADPGQIAEKATSRPKASGNNGCESQTKVGMDQEWHVKEDEKERTESAQRVFIGWMQARHREFITLISLCCVIASLVEHVKKRSSGTVAVALIPVAVHILLLWDIYIKHERRRKTPSDQKRRHREETASSHSLVCQRDASKTKSGSGVVEYGGNTGRSNNRREIEECDRGELAGGRRGMGTMWGNSTSGTSLSASEAGGDTESSTLCRDYSPSKSPGSSAGPCMGGRVPGWGVTTGQLLRNDSMSSGNRSAVGGQSARSDATEESGAGGAGEEEDSFSFALEGTGAAEENLLSLLETPFQQSVRLLKNASESISDPVVRRQLQRVAKLLSDPDALHVIREGSIRRVTSDMGTRSYIENVLQTPVKSSSADRNWRKLRTGMFVVRAMAKEAEAAETAAAVAALAAGTADDSRTSSDAQRKGSVSQTSHGGKGDEPDLDELLEDIVNGVPGVSSPLRCEGYVKKIDLSGWDMDAAATFNQLNRGLIQEQQLVAKTMSRGDLRKDLDRLTVRELRDLVANSKMPEKILEHPAGEHNEASEGGVVALACEIKRIPRLPSLDEGVGEETALLLAGERFLEWDFNVFELDKRSNGHSLWFAAMSTCAYYNLIGAFGMSVDRLSELFLCIEATYCYNPEEPNSYHTHVHAADVTLTVAHFLSVDAISTTVRSTHGLALLMAAIMHDYRHPGVNNGYLVRDLDPLAVTYNDVSVLENFHAAEGFKMMLDPRFDIFKGWKPEDVKFFRHAYVKCILATDLALSLEYISKFQSLANNILAYGSSSGNTVSNGSISGSSNGSGNVNQGGSGGRGLAVVGKGTGKDKIGSKGGAGPGESIQSQTLLLQMVLKVADVAHPCKPWDIHNKWSELVTQEFFAQGDREIAQGLAVSPLCDRKDVNLAKSQCDFIDFIVRPCVTIFSSYCKVSTWNDHLDSNFRAWRALQEVQSGPSRPSSPLGNRRRSAR